MEKQAPKPIQIPLRVLYISFTILAIGSMLFGNFQNTIMYGGIALAFDPFDPGQAYDKRPGWQRIWLYAHVTSVLIITTILLYRKFG